MKIDVVLLWVTASDPKWRQKRDRYLQPDDAGGRAPGRNQGSGPDGKENPRHPFDADDELYRDWGTLRYLLRGINDYMPWVNRIFLATDEQRPTWLTNTTTLTATDHIKAQASPELILIDHRDFLPDAYRPTFSSHAIELNLHRIPGLAEHFIYFNDDMLPAKPLKPTDFFIGGLPSDHASLFRISQPNYDSIYGHVLLNNAALLNQHFSTHDLKKQRQFYSPRQGLAVTLFSLPYLHYRNLPGFFNAHGPQPYLKSSFEKLWQLEPDVLDQTSRHKFREIRDLNQYVFRDYQLLTGKWRPKNIIRRTRFFKDFPDKFPALEASLRNHKTKIVCINDDVTKDFAESLKRMHEILETHYQNPSPWEINHDV